MNDDGSTGLERLAGFVVQAGIEGKSPEEAAGEIRDLGVNGLLLFKKDVTGESEAVRRRISLLRKAVRSSFRNENIEPLFGIDQEGGYVARIERVASPSAMAFGASDDERLTSHSAFCVGSYLHGLGINWNLAPVLDILYDPRNPVIGTRSFGSDPIRVAELGSAYMEGMARAHVLGCAKHFPGHGRTATDSHLDLPVIDEGIEQLMETDLLPFGCAIERGVASVMVGHMYFRNIQHDDLPSSLSPDIVDGILRRRMGYDRLVVTDALEMHAVSNRFSIGEAAVLSIRAGCDIVMTTGFDQAHEAKNAILEAAEKGEITKERLFESRRRIVAAMDSIRRNEGQKSRYGQISFEELTRRASNAFRTASQLAVTATGELKPVGQDEKIAVIIFKGARSIASDPQSESLDREAERFFNVVFSAKVEGRARDPAAEQKGIAAGLAESIKSSGAATVLLCTRESHIHTPQLETAGELARSGLRVIGVGMGTPYEAAALARSGVREYVCGYSQTRESVEALLQAIAGHYTPRGKAPIRMG